MTNIGTCIYSQTAYGGNNTKEYLACVTKKMSTESGYTPPIMLWIVTEVYAGDTATHAYFPKPVGTTYNNIVFDVVDRAEPYFTYFDSQEIKVYPQLLPSDADVTDLIKLTLDRYSSHSCIAGIGVDIEWLQFTKYIDGRTVTNAEAKKWIDQIKTYNSAYKLQLTHWLHEKMPTTHYTDVIYIDDVQGTANLTDLVSDFHAFASNFNYINCGVDIGYMTDYSWWKNLSNPPIDIASAMKTSVSALEGAYWWGDTLKTVYPTCTPTTCNNPTFDFTLS